MFLIIRFVRSDGAAVQTVATSTAQSAAVLVIDAGHGGLDGGASAADGTAESVLNLQIAERMRQLCALLGMACVMTRTSEELDYPDESASVHAKKVWDQQSRVALIRDTENAVLISIHQNNYPDSCPCGSQVLYAGTEGSAHLGELTHRNLISQLDPENRRIAAPISDSIYLMKNVDCPAILVECGFLSNPDDAAKLKSGAYQTALATVIVGSYLQFLGDMT
ncbi:MAG: N-acetylmuramoyl-L-alanine amidase [Oscillospiraceae bacterium]|nr:N-acetylmuramoyl-L-alanine amidase [Oscillospiraceae bacterium]